MWGMLYESLRGRALRWIIALATLLGVAGALGLHLSAAEATTATVAQVLDLQRLTGYDLLVRPAGSRSEVQQVHVLLEPGHLLGIPGGITFDQYAAIRALPGVEVAAPLANLGYYRQPLYVWLSPPEEFGVYSVSCRTEEPFGPRTRREEQVTLRSAGAGATPEEQQALREAGVEPDLLPPVCAYAYAFSLTAIDPEQEAALFGLDATIWGDYPRTTWSSRSRPTRCPPARRCSTPSRRSSAPPRTSRRRSPARSRPWVGRGGSLAARGARGRRLRSSRARRRSPPRCSTAPPATRRFWSASSGARGRRFNLPHFSRWAPPSPIAYREHQESPADLPQPVFEAEPVGAAGEAEGDGRVPVFRPADPERLESGLLFRFVGTYDPALLPYAPDVCAPTIYALPSVEWTHDAEAAPSIPSP